MKVGEILMTHMQGQKLKKSFVPDGIELALIDLKGMVKEGKLVEPFMNRKAGYLKVRGHDIFVSSVPGEYLNIAFVVVQSESLSYELEALRTMLSKVMVFAAILMAMITWVLSKLFMKAMRQREA
jgi:hypothetical protein